MLKNLAAISIGGSRRKINFQNRLISFLLAWLFGQQTASLLLSRATRMGCDGSCADGVRQSRAGRVILGAH